MFTLTLSVLLLLAAPPPGDAPELVVQTTQDRGFAAIAVSADGRLLAAPVDYQGILRVWDLGSGLQVKTHRLPIDASGAAFLPDGRVALAGTDSTVTLHAPTSDAPPVVLQGRFDAQVSITNYHAAVATSGDGRVAAGGFTGTLGTAKTLLETGSDAGRTDLGIVQAPDLHPVVRVWRADALEETLTLPDGNHHVTSLAFSPDGRRLVAGTDHATAACWNLGDPAPAWVIADPDRLTDTAVDVAPGGRTVAVARGRQLAVHDARTGRLRATWTAEADLRRVRFVARDRLVTTSVDGLVRTWIVGRPAPVVATLEAGPYGDIARVGRSDVLAFTRGRGVVLWDAARDVLVRAMQPTPSIAQAVWAAPERSVLVATGAHLRTWGTTTDATSPGLDLPGPVSALRNSVDGAFVAVTTAGDAPALSVVAGATPKLCWSVPAPGASSLDVSPDGALVGALVNRRAVAVYDAATGAARGAFPVVAPGGADVVFGMAFEAHRGPDASLLTIGRVGGHRYAIQRWGVATGEATLLATLEAPGPMTNIVASPIGPWVAASFPEGRAVAAINFATGQARDIPTNGVVLRFSPVEPLLAIGTSSGEVVLWDAEGGRELRRFRLTPTFIDELSFTRDGTALIAGGRDGSVHVLSMREHLATAFFTADSRLVVTPAGFYLGDVGAMAQVAFRIGDRAYPFEQLDLQLHRPERVLERLGAAPALVARYGQLTERRRRRAGVATDPDGAAGTPPTLALRGARPPVSTARRTLRLALEARAGSHDPARLDVFVNDVPLFGRAGRPVTARAGVARVRVDVALLPGRNKVQVVTHDAVGLASARETFEVQCTAREGPRDLYVVAVGISRFADPRMNLEYAAKDAVDIARLLRRQADAYRAVEVHFLLDAEAAAAHAPLPGETVGVATRDAVIALRDDLRRARPEDEVVFFVSGHGLVDDAMQYRVPTTDFDFAAPSRGGVTFEELEDLLDGVAARRKLLLLDTCHAGELDAADATRRTTPAGTVVVRPLARAKTAVGARELAPQDGSQVVEDLFVALRRGSGATVIAATRGAELAFEADRWDNGAFTLALREALECGRGAGPDGAVHLSDLWRYVATRVPALTDGLQRPVARQRNLAEDARVVARPPFADPGTCTPGAASTPP